ncbi:retropepsin-like aspartic protease family protein [Azotobacter beijerinckii]|uniref:Aspartyl protease family protein n=1 Tax=Azotobacter beijerinckii TaxID=170623 RepID=A0A1I3ZA49_9GAMM|nr:TIGR02281 family clan AA aspartic protease [Azotobacter beijerinckii]SFA81475.1 aspartyl protease family protein [Azotobacter beijerinckii]SFK40964.1 aspartyl protease family protein [Azotobacter beijerinckii]
MLRFRWFVAGLPLAVAASLAAAPQVRVVGLFPGAAVVNLDGRRQLLKVGQEGPGGVRLIAADSRGALLQVDGVERRYELAREYGEGDGFAPPGKARLGVARGEGGHYWVAGAIGGQSVQFLVDTGATTVALSESQARRLGIDYRGGGRPVRVSTANGTTQGWQVKLERVKVGALEVLGVEAVVLQGDSPSTALLGMSFLNRVRWREEQGLLMLESKL